MRSKIRPQWVFSLGMLLAVCLTIVVQTWGDDSEEKSTQQPSSDASVNHWLRLYRMNHDQRAEVVRQMSAIEKEKLLKKWDQFKGLDENAKTELRQLHQQIVGDPQRDRLHQVMVRYHEWLGGLRSSQRADLLSLKDPEERIQRIRQIVKEQEERKFAELLEKELSTEDLRGIRQWVEQFVESTAKKIESRETEVFAKLDEEQQRRLKAIDDPVQRNKLLAMGALLLTLPEDTKSKLDFILPTKEDFQRLRDELSPRGRELLDQADSIAKKQVLVRRWLRAAFMSRRKALPKVSDETLEAFRRGELEFKLTLEDQERLERLSGERLKQQLKWYYYRYRGDLEPGNNDRSNSRTGNRGNGGRRGSGRSSGGGRPRPPQQDKNQFIDRPPLPSRSR